MQDRMVKIVAVSPLSNEALGLIRSMSDRITVEQVSPLIAAEKKGGKEVSESGRPSEGILNSGKN